MAFDKLVSNSVVGATKNGIKMNLTVTALKDKAIDTVASQIEKQIPIELPFSTREILNGGTLPSNFLSPDILNTAKDLAPPIPEPQRVQIVGVLDGIESALNGVIQTVNVIKGTLNTITAPLNTLETVASTLNTLVSVLENAIIIVKAIPIPLGSPVGVGIPANVVTGFADILVKTDKQIEKIKPPLEAVPDAIATVNRILIPIVASLNLFTPIFEKIIQIITFIRLLLQPGPVSQADIDSTLSSITSNIQESLAVTAGPSESSSNAEANKAANDALLFSLESGNYTYRGFRLTLEFDSTNTFNFPARRIKAFREISADNAFNETGEAFGVTLYSSPPDQGAGGVNTSSPYSFSSSTQVLVDETIFNIDQYLLEFTRNNSEVESEVEDIPSSTVEDIPSSTPLTPAQILENLVNQARQSLISRGFTELEAKWIMEKSGLLVQNIAQQVDSGIPPNEFFKQLLINKGFSGGQVNYLLSANSAFGWVEYIQGSYPNPSPSNINTILQIPVNIFGLSPYTGS
jgi:hypothetical protein